MISTLQIGNFKAFAETQRIPIRPLTLIYGANSSGKSSVIHALILARHALETGDANVHRTGVGGEAVDLGGFRQYIHRRETGRRMDWAAELDVSAFKGRLAEFFASTKYVSVSLTLGIALDDQGRTPPEASPKALTYEVLADGASLFRMSKRREGNLQLDRLDHEHSVFRDIPRINDRVSSPEEMIKPSDLEKYSEVIADIVHDIVADPGMFFPSGLIRRKPPFTTDPRLVSGEKAGDSTPDDSLRGKVDIESEMCLILPDILDKIVTGLASALTDDLKSLQYLGPLRSYPPRHIAFSAHHDLNRFAGGAYAWDVLRRDEGVRDLVNEWLGSEERLQTPYELRVRNLLTIDDLDVDYKQYIEKLDHRFTSEEYDWDLFGEIYSALDRLKERESTFSEVQELNLIDRRSNTIVSHRDVGIGVSQVIPVLVGAYASKRRLIAIEQPEIHLHPALQADLGDVFIQSALGGSRNRFMIETHSEYLLLRIMRRMRQTAAGELPEGFPSVTPDDVSILFVQPKGSRSVVRRLELDEEGQLLDPWPGGFFEEGFRERFF